MSPEATAINAAFVANILTQRATIYTRATSGPTNGQYTVSEQANLACRLDAVTPNDRASLPVRAVSAAARMFRYDATYSLPRTGVQIEVDAYPGDRWNPVGGTDDVDNLPGIGTIGKTVLVERA